MLCAKTRKYHSKLRVGSDVTNNPKMVQEIEVEEEAQTINPNSGTRCT